QPRQVACDGDQEEDEAIDQPVVAVDQDPVNRLGEEIRRDRKMPQVLPVNDGADEVEGDRARCDERRQQAQNRGPAHAVGFVWLDRLFRWR
ncbi:hypothetical protein DQE80_15320, partial [Enterococcus sp. HPCN18]